MSAPRRALLLANAKARRGAELAQHARQSLEAAGMQLISPRFSDRDEVSTLIRAHAGAVDCVIVVGGDGSINAALPGLLSTGLPLGLIPAGTANDLAATLGLPTDPDEAAAVIVAGHAMRIDVGQVNDVPFVNAASLGMSVQITRKLTRSLKRRWGVLAYAIASIKALWRARPFEATIVTDQGAAYVRTVQIVVGNGRHFGSGMTVADDARIDDATLDLYSVGVYHWWSLLGLLPALRRGTHRAKRGVYTARGRAFDVTTRRPRPISADGELLTRTPASFRLLPGAIEVFVPASGAP